MSNPWLPVINGPALRAARLGRGRTLRQLAAEASALGTDVDFGNLSRAERTGRGLGARKVAVVIRVLDANPADLVTGLTDEQRDLLAALADPRTAAGVVAGGAAA